MRISFACPTGRWIASEHAHYTQNYLGILSAVTNDIWSLPSMEGVLMGHLTLEPLCVLNPGAGHTRFLHPIPVGWPVWMRRIMGQARYPSSPCINFTLPMHDKLQLTVHLPESLGLFHLKLLCCLIDLSTLPGQNMYTYSYLWLTCDFSFFRSFRAWGFRMNWYAWLLMRSELSRESAMSAQM